MLNMIIPSSFIATTLALGAIHLPIYVDKGDNTVIMPGSLKVTQSLSASTINTNKLKYKGRLKDYGVIAQGNGLTNGIVNKSIIEKASICYLTKTLHTSHSSYYQLCFLSHSTSFLGIRTWRLAAATLAGQQQCFMTCIS